MENTPQVQATNSTPIADNTTSQNDNWVWIALGVVGLYLVFRNKSKKKVEEPKEEGGINTYEDFSGTNLGKSVNRQLKTNYIELSKEQINDLNTCFQGLTAKEKRILKKACEYTSKESLVRGIGRKNLKVFLPIRQRIINCFGEQKIGMK